MKTTVHLIVAVLAAAFISGCATTSDHSALVRPTAGTIGVVLLASTKDSAKRTEYANYLYSTAVAIRTLTGSVAPTPQQLEAAVLSFVPGSSPEYVRLAASLASQYAAIYIKFPTTSPELQRYLEGLACGLEDAAAPWISKRSANLYRAIWQMRHGPEAPVDCEPWVASIV